ncbi:hypothetical protein [Micromonospora sp. C28ISP2-4]|uniref:hypothetical protein n=1 Tax=Micromonospora TaxID=1873 RepID=UPI002676070C|nr:hypothetical protein [Micromonospora sp. C28ISP2-4]MDO3685956.1 hypothetical protein [Micromonospora sp. C28ISP2-4]
MPTSATIAAHVLDLASHFNNVGASRAEDTSAGRFNVWGNSFAAEHLPSAGSQVVVDGVPFQLPPLGTGMPDNVRCDGQFVRVAPGRYDWLYLLASAERRVEDEMALHFAHGAVDFEPLRVSDFWAAPATFGETRAFESPLMHYPHHVQFGVPAAMWCQRVPVVRRADLTAVRLPHNIAVHVFAATLVGPVEEANR